ITCQPLAVFSSVRRSCMKSRWANDERNRINAYSPFGWPCTVSTNCVDTTVRVSIAPSGPCVSFSACVQRCTGIARWNLSPALALADNLDGPATFASAGDKFQRAMPVQRWTQALKDTHGPLGAMLTRTVVSTQFVDTVQGQPKGEYALILFRSSFAHRDFMQERLTLEKTAKGWQVIGYFPH